MTINFSGHHFPKAVILLAVRYYVAYQLSYRNIEEIFKERGIKVYHATLNRWVIKFTPLLEETFRKKKRQTHGSWRMDETYIKVKGRWVYYYRAVDKYGDVFDFYLSEKRDEPAAMRFLKRAIDNNGLPYKVVIDKSGANMAALDKLNIRLWLMGGMLFMVEVLDVKYLNNIVEQSHRPVKRKMRQALTWQSWAGAVSTLAGIEVWTMIKNGQLQNNNGMTACEQFYALAA